MSPSMDTDNKAQDTLILGEETTQGLDGITLIAEAIYLINSTQPNKTFVLSLCYNWSNSFWFLMLQKHINLKQKIWNKILCLGNVSKYLQLITRKKTGFRGVVKNFSVDFNLIDTNDILDIQKYLMKRTWYKILFRLIRKTFFGFLTGLVNGSNHTKCLFLGN